MALGAGPDLFSRGNSSFLVGTRAGLKEYSPGRDHEASARPGDVAQAGLSSRASFGGAAGGGTTAEG